MLDEIREGIVELASLLSEWVGGIKYEDFDVGGAKFGETLTAYERVGINCGDDATRDARGDECFCAWAGAAVMRARLEGDVGRRAVGAVADGSRLLQCGDFGVVACVVVMRALAEEGVAVCEDAAYGGIGAGETDRFAGEH
jgi:hypothetical protein